MLVMLNLWLIFAELSRTREKKRKKTQVKQNSHKSCERKAETKTLMFLTPDIAKGHYR